MKAVLTRGAMCHAERLGTAPNQTWLIADAEHTDEIMNVVATRPLSYMTLPGASHAPARAH